MRHYSTLNYSKKWNSKHADNRYKIHSNNLPSQLRRMIDAKERFTFKFGEDSWWEWIYLKDNSVNLPKNDLCILQTTTYLCILVVIIFLNCINNFIWVSIRNLQIMAYIYILRYNNESINIINMYIIKFQ